MRNRSVKKSVYPGMIFGSWEVLNSTQLSARGELKWLCRCKCGTERYVLERSLKYGGSKSCGCITIENGIKANAHELTGKVFGDLTVLSKAEIQSVKSGTGIKWKCRCSCGAELDVLATLLVKGRKTNCGCKTNPNYYFKDIQGQTFGRLTAKYPTAARDRKGGLIWHCQCTCGNEVDVPYKMLVDPNLRSCGCQKKEHDQMMQSFLTRVGGTSIDLIRSKKIPTSNTSGIKGVYFQKGKWIAKIVFQKKQYHLGKFDSIEEAAAARRKGEKIFFGSVLDFYEHWKEKADSDPDWAEHNPIKIIVKKQAGNEIAITCLPVI